MAENSKIEWTDATWNPLVAFDKETDKRGWFCTKVSSGCVNCYAEGINRRLGNGYAYMNKNLDKIEFRLTNLDQPLRWKRPRRIFVNSMTDLFHRDVPDAMIDRVLAVLSLAPWHTFQLLTKRAGRMAEYFAERGEVEERIGWAQHELYEEFGSLPVGVFAGPAHFRLPIPNLWLGVSVENQITADERVPCLLKIPAAVRWLSVEPLLDKLNLRSIYPKGRRSGELFDALMGIDTAQQCHLSGKLDWVVVGGESGPRARPMHPDWLRSLRDQCVSTGVPFFFKQWGTWAPDRFDFPPEILFKSPVLNFGVPMTVMRKLGKKTAGRVLDGRAWDEFPKEVSAHAAVQTA